MVAVHGLHIEIAHFSDDVEGDEIKNGVQDCELVCEQVDVDEFTRERG